MCFIWKTDICLASQIASSTSGAPLDMQWSRLGNWGMWAWADTEYSLASIAKQLNSESVKTWARNK